jgi:hypothetical protein
MTARCPHGRLWFTICGECHDAACAKVGHYLAVTLRGAVKEALFFGQYIESPYGQTLPLTRKTWGGMLLDNRLRWELNCQDEPAPAFVRNET